MLIKIQTLCRTFNEQWIQPYIEHSKIIRLNITVKKSVYVSSGKWSKFMQFKVNGVTFSFILNKIDNPISV